MRGMSRVKTGKIRTQDPSLAWGGIHPGIYGVVGNVLVTVLVSLRTAPMDREHVAQFVSI